jgi:hypothetical protein
MSLALIIALCLPAWLQLMVMADFYASRDYIARTLCIKKDEVRNDCGGSCHLSKQLAKTKEKDCDQESPVPPVKAELSPGILSETHDIIQTDPQASRKPIHEKDLYMLLRVSDFFHPPA